MVREHLKMSDVEVAFHLGTSSLAGARAQQGPCSVLTTSKAGGSYSFQGTKGRWVGGWEAALTLTRQAGASGSEGHAPLPGEGAGNVTGRHI